LKRYGNLYHKIYDVENLKLAHINARKGKLKYTDVKMVDSDVDKYLLKIHNMLKNKTYEVSEYKVFNRFDGKKEREIFVLPYYPDRIIQWAILQIVGDIWINSFIEQTYSSIKNRGIHQCLKHIKRDIYNNELKYCLKLDIRKFYPSIDNEILKKILRNKIKDKDLLELLDKVIDSAKGVPIGNYLSQFFGNLYLNKFDHWMKENNKCKFYYRYCDDIVILSDDKRELHILLYNTKKYLKTNLNLEVKNNHSVFPIDKRGIDFLGYRIFKNYILVRKSIVKNMKNKMAKLSKFNTLTKNEKSVVSSYYGWCKYADSYRLKEKYINKNMNKKVSD
jgi:hypothetical protein